MVDQYYPDTAHLLAQQASRRRWLMVGTVLCVLLVTGIIAAVAVLQPKASPGGTLAAGLVVVVVAAIPVVVWNWPRFGLYVLAITSIACGAPQGSQTILVPTTYIPFWWNLSIAGRTYGLGNALAPIVFSPAELIWILTAVCWVMRRILSRDLELRRGELLLPISVLCLMFVMGALHGWVSHGNTTIILWEIRPLFLFLACYLLTCWLVTEKAHVVKLLWALAISIAVMSVCYSASWSTGDRTDFGIKGMDHGDSMAMCLGLFITFLSVILAYDKRLTWLMVLSLPTVLLALLGNNRRAGVASFVIAFIPLVPLLWLVFKDRRLQVARFAIFFAVFSAVYLPIAWNGKGTWAFPAQALRSGSDPSARDQASNNYRYAEDVDLKMNRDLEPWTGIGFGKEFARFIPLPYIGDSELLRYMPHNSVLWIWMRIGHFGFLAFIMMLAAILVRGTQAIRAIRDKGLRIVGTLALMQVIMHYVYGKYDLLWTNPRMLCLTGILVGVVGSIRRIDADSDAPEAGPPASAEAAS